VYYFYSLKKCGVLYVLWFAFILIVQNSGFSTGVLISPYPDQEGNKLMFLSEWREFPSVPCLAEKKKNLITAHISMLKLRVPDMLLSFLVGLRTYKHLGTSGKLVVLATFPV